MRYNPPVFQYKAAFMQRIADYVRLGYRYWVAGEVRADRARALLKKFDTLYRVSASRHQRAYARGKGEASAVFLLYAPSSVRNGRTAADDTVTTDTSAPTAASLRWILLLTPGQHLAQQLETLSDAHDIKGRIHITGYELVQLPRPGQERPAWTWRMKRDIYEGWRLRLLSAARRGTEALEGELERIRPTPGFAGCRAQVRKLITLARAEHRRRFPGSQPPTTGRIHYVQRLPSGEMTLRDWLAANSSVSPQRTGHSKQPVDGDKHCQLQKASKMSLP